MLEVCIIGCTFVFVICNGSKHEVEEFLKYVSEQERQARKQSKFCVAWLDIGRRNTQVPIKKH